MRRGRLAGWLLVPIVLALGCDPPSEPTIVALRLVDAYRPESVAGRLEQPAAPARTERRFDGERPEGGPEALAATWGWEAGPGVEGLAVRDGRLTGRTTSDFPILHLDWPEASRGADTAHALELRLAVSAGTIVEASGSGAEKVDLAEEARNARDWPWDLRAELAPGGEMQTVTLRPPRADLPPRHLLLRPTDAAGAEFAIESVRIVLRREHLASIPSGVSFQGLSQVFRESLVGRAPETIRFPLTVPEGGFLDLAVGTVEEGPVTFRVGFAESGGAAGEAPLLERTVTTAHRWEEVAIDLSPLAGRAGTLELALAAEAEGAIGLWGSPVVRVRGARPESEPPTAPRGVIVV